MDNLDTSLILLIVFIFFLIFIIPAIIFMICQQNILKAIQPHNRYMQPGEVWLQLIPLFGLVWQFIVVTRISESIKKELWDNNFSFEDQRYNTVGYGERPTYNIGIAYCVLFCCGILCGVFSLAGLVCWIIYWVRLAEYKKDIEAKQISDLYPPANDYNAATP
jgi:hypothetical protein